MVKNYRELQFWIWLSSSLSSHKRSYPSQIEDLLEWMHDADRALRHFDLLNLKFRNFGNQVIYRCRMLRLEYVDWADSTVWVALCAVGRRLHWQTFDAAHCSSKDYINFEIFSAYCFTSQSQEKNLLSASSTRTASASDAKFPRNCAKFFEFWM